MLVLKKEKQSTIKLLLKLLLLLTILVEIMVFVSQATAQILITEVLYNPINTESGGEVIELYNPTNKTINISNWKISSESSDKDAVMAPNTSIAPEEYFLIADTGFSLKKDNSSWPDANYEETITLSNTNAGIALIDINNKTIDAVGWGETSEINTGLYEGTPVEHVLEGLSLQRKFNTTFQDTNNNINDFISKKPSLKQATILEKTIIINTTINNTTTNNETIKNESQKTNFSNTLIIKKTLFININNKNTTITSFEIKNNSTRNITLKIKSTNFTTENKSFDLNWINYSINNFETEQKLTRTFQETKIIKSNEKINLSLKIKWCNQTNREYKGRIIFESTSSSINSI